MSNRIADGEPAFPRPASIFDDEHAIEQDGMSLRDYFAGQAIMGIMANASIPDLMSKGFRPDGVSEAVYAIADAMLVARKAVQP